MQAHAPAQMGMKQAGIAAHPSGPKAFFLEALSPTVQFCKLLISEPLIIPEGGYPLDSGSPNRLGFGFDPF